VGVPWDKRVGRMIEAMDLCRALWGGKPVDWNGRWEIKGETVAPTPAQPGGPPIWCGGRVPAAWSRAARHFDGWFPNGPDSARWGQGWAEVKKAAAAAGRDPARMVGAAYLTVAIDEPARAEARIAKYLESYYGQPFDALRSIHTYFAGPEDAAAAWLKGYADAGVSHFVLRFAGDHERQLETVARVRKGLGW
jgi:alkanesulfonate monooxygenase SsuD/methylene tetrahydromethanopterin reductase-like flavin-dependent oxidoreductase (luciferase family)